MRQPVAKTRDPRNDTVRKNMRRFREEADLTAEKVAAFTGLSIDSLRRYEAGKSGVPGHVLRVLSEVYGHKMEDFYLDDPPAPDLRHRPAVALTELGVDGVPPELIARAQDVIDEINRYTRGEKQPTKRPGKKKST